MGRFDFIWYYFLGFLKVASVEVPLYVTFHFINAYEEKDEDGRVTAIIADCCEHHADTTILERLRLQNLRAFMGEDVLPDARYVID
jgi:carlactone synthase/all-trans-10'-apo-beta-carotenal 13,14-cleaving dioxygenase